MNDLPKIFSQATTTDRWTHKYDLSRPFRQGGYTWATDGRILVRTERTDLDFDEYDRKLVNAEQVPKMLDGLKGFCARLPEAIGRYPCKECDGIGETTSDELVCEECQGIHRMTYKGKPLTRDCEECNGKGSVPNMKFVQVSSDPVICLAEYYIAMLHEHGVHEVAVYALDKPVRFYGDGFDGWLMPQDSKRVAELERKKRFEATPA